MIRSQTARQILDFLFIVAGVAAAQALYDVLFPSRYAYLTPEQRIYGGALSSLTLWIVIRAYDHTGAQNLRSLLDQLCIATGVVLLIQAVLNYFHFLIRSMFLILAGAGIAGLLLGCAYLWLYAPEEEKLGGALLIGSHPLMANLARRLGVAIVGSIPGDASDPDLIASASSGKRVSHILIAPDAAISKSLSDALVEWRRRGVAVLRFAQLYEQLYHRVYGAGLSPAELLLSPSLEADSRAMAIQAVYTNLIGLFLVVALSPVILVTAIAVALLSGKGPVIEALECAGFHNIPFLRYRFRVLKTDGSGRYTAIGAFLRRTRLHALPQLFNIVRGEMVLFGPKPVRTIMAAHLTGLMPFYALRFSVKPGVTGWAQANLSGPSEAYNELDWLEYDLYYIKHVSFWMDLDIALQWILGPASLDTSLSDAGVQVE